MHFEGEKDFALPPKEAFAKLSDARFLVDCIPNKELTVHADQHKAICKQRSGFAFMHGTLELTIVIHEAIPHTTIRYSLLAKGIGSSSDVETVMSLTAQDPGTHVHWKAEIKSLGGLLKAVPSGLIQGAAQKVIADVWHEVGKRITAG